MKKLLVLVCASMLVAFTAHAEKRIGLSAAYTMLDSSGTEETKSSGEKNSKTFEEDVIVPSLFLEFANDHGLALGFEIVPVDDQEIGSGTGDDDDAETSGANTASAELTGHYSIYGLAPIGSNGAYFKFGMARATIETADNLSTGTTYGNMDVDGIIVGLGVNKTSDNGKFFRFEGTYTDYEDVQFLGSLDTDSVRNKVDADIDAIALRVSIGKAF
jgi:hypothetical protein